MGGEKLFADVIKGLSMRTSGLRVGHKSGDRVLRGEGQEFGHTDTEGRRPCEGGAETGVMGSQSHRLEEGRKESLPEPPEGAWSRWRLDFRLLASRTVRESLAVVLSCLVHGNLLLQPWRPYRLVDPGQVPSPSASTVPLPGPLLTSPQCQPARDPSRISGAWWAREPPPAQHCLCLDPPVCTHMLGEGQEMHRPGCPGQDTSTSGASVSSSRA